jgi:hypothetical protein
MSLTSRNNLNIPALKPNYYITPFYDFRGGINDTVPPDSMQDNELRECTNALISKRGGAELRDGTEMFVNAMASFSNEVTQCFEWHFSDDSVKYIAVIDQDLCEIDASTGASTVKQAITRDYIAYVVHQDTLWFSDGDEFYQWGWFHYAATGTKTIALNDIVYNYPASAGGGTSKHYYKAKAAHGSTDLTAEDFSVVARWEDVTDGVIPDDIRAVVATGDALDPFQQCKYMVYSPLSDRLLVAGGVDDPYGLYYSEIYTTASGFSDFTATNVLYPNTSSGPVAGLKIFFDSIVVAYKTAWYAFSGTAIAADSKWKPLPIPVGANNDESILLVPNGFVFYKPKQGLFYINPAILDVSPNTVPSNELYFNLTNGKMETLIDSIVHPDTTRMVYDDDKIYFAFGDDSSLATNNKVLVYDWNLKAFSMVIEGWQVNSFMPTKAGDLYFGTSNYILKANSGLTDIATETGGTKPINMTILTKAYNLGDIIHLYNRKWLEQAYFQAQQPEGGINNLRITIISGFTDTEASNVSTGGSRWGANWGFIWGRSEFSTYFVDADVTDYRHQIKFEGAGFDYNVNDVSANISEGDIVQNYPLGGGGTIYHIYRAESDLGETVFATEDFSDTNNWEDITSDFTQNEFFLYSIGFKFRLSEDTATELGG